jgi:hypothetical protein
MAHAKRQSEELGGTPFSASRPRVKLRFAGGAMSDDDDDTPEIPGMEPHQISKLLNMLMHRVKGGIIAREVTTAVNELGREVRQDVVEEIKSAMAPVLAENQKLRDENGVLEKDLAALKSRFDQFLVTGSAGTRDSLAALKTQMQELDTKFRQMQAEKGSKDKEVKDAKDAVKKCQRDLAGCEKQISEFEGKIQGMGNVSDVKAISLQVEELMKSSKKREEEAATAPSPEQGNYAEALKKMQTMEQQLCTVQKLQQVVNERDEKDSLHRTFKVVGRYPAGNSVGAKLRAVLEPLNMAGISMDIVKGLKGRGDNDGPILFRVRHAQDAEQLRRMRTQLKGKGYAIVDELSNTEYEAFKKLKPQFDDARKAGKAAWWNRARLFIGGKEVMPPCDQAMGRDPMHEAA